MEKEQFIDNLEAGLDETLRDRRFNSYRKQIAAWKLSADFIRSYSEDYLWRKAIYLSSNGCILLDSNANRRLAITSLRAAAEIFENLSSISEEFDRDYCLILASLCYDLSGYQANALCLTRMLDNYILETELAYDLSLDNYIFTQVRQVLSKKIFDARATINNAISADIGTSLFNTAMKSWYDAVLNGIENDFLGEIDRAYKYFLFDNNVYVSHLLYLVRARIKIYTERSIWNNLLDNENIRGNSTWSRYIKLLTHDIYDRSSIKESKNRVSKFEFWTSQLRAIESGILNPENGNFVLQMPTSAGKTFIAEIAILNSLVNNPGKKCVYIAPFRALTNEKEAELAENISRLGYSVSALSGSYELDEFQNIILEETDVLVATPEKIDLLIRLNPVYFDNVSLVVVDEGHIVGDISSRSSLLEFLIIQLRIRVQNLKTLFISAVMPPENADEYSLWLSGQSGNVIRSKLFPDSSPEEEWEPTKKLIGEFRWSGNNGRITYKNVETEDEDTRDIESAFIPAIIRKRLFADRFPNGNNKAQTSAALAYKLAEEGNCLVYCAQVRDTERVGNALLDIIAALEQNGVDVLADFQANGNRESYFFSAKWFGTKSYITRCLERGIGVHYGDMPEAVRRAVEADYSTGKLRVLIATNTVGQGLNFPIKYLIVHSTILGRANNRSVTVSVRDFWNLIGRAGRAGKETEGQVIFVSNSDFDLNTYARLTNKDNIEPAYSMFFNVLSSLMAERISEDEFGEYLKILSEPYILSLLVEELLGTEDEEIINSIINNSLFKVQADTREIEIQSVRNSFRAIISTIRQEVSQELMEVYRLTGFSLKSNQAISAYIDANLDNLIDIITDDDYMALLDKIFSLFAEGNIDEVGSEKLNRIAGNENDYVEVAKLWVNGNEIDELLIAWSQISTIPNHIHILISEGFYFRYPWGISAFLTILGSYLDDGLEVNYDNIKNLSSYLKYGLNNPTACLARSIGIKNRDVALLLAEYSGFSTGKDFIKWVANLSNEDVGSYDLNIYDQQNILSTAIKLTPNRFDEIPDTFEFNIKGIPFEESRIENSRAVNIGDFLNYEREATNIYDPYAIKIFWNELELGYVPREHSRTISVDLDINQANYQIEVIGVNDQVNFRSITVKMQKMLE